MITLDEIVPYQPPTQFPSKPSQPFKLTQSSLHCLPPLIHPLPQRPTPPIALPEHTGDLHQVHHDWNPPPVKHRGISPQANAFDSELATLDMVELDNATLTNVNQNGHEKQPGTNTSGLSRRESIVPRDGETLLFLVDVMIMLDFKTTDGRLTAVRRPDIPDGIESSRLQQHASPGDKGLLAMSSELMELELQAPAEAVCDSDYNSLDVRSCSDQIESMFSL
jgi:hypothetical protein